MVAKENLHTVREFMEFVMRPENADKRFELIDGMIVEMQPSTIKSSVLTSWFAVPLWKHAEHSNTNMVFTGPNAVYAITDINAFQPDVAMIAKDRMGGWEGIEFPVAPELAVEVLSPYEDLHVVQTKIPTYLQAGTKVVLVAYPDQCLIDVYRLNADGNVILSTLRDEADLTLDDVLPGFKVSLTEIFSVLDLD